MFQEDEENSFEDKIVAVKVCPALLLTMFLLLLSLPLTEQT